MLLELPPAHLPVVEQITRMDSNQLTDRSVSMIGYSTPLQARGCGRIELVAGNTIETK
jgi:hypothetical protein